MNASHTALGQALGYSYQFHRAAYCLLDADDTLVSVSVEYLDDVSVVHENGRVIREQDKATIGQVTPLGDRSVALWKTLAIWAEEVHSDPSLLSKTEFHLVTNGKVGATTLAAEIGRAQSFAEAKTVGDKVLKSASSLRGTLQPFASKLKALSREQVAALIQRIFVFDNIASPYAGDLSTLQSLRMLGDMQRRIVFDGAAGFVHRAALKAAEEGRPATIDRLSFDAEIRALFRRVAVAPLSVTFDFENGEVEPSKYRAYGFFQQLDWIDTDVTFIRECVIHFVQARAARLRWTDTHEVSEASLLSYRADLKSRWRLEVQRQVPRSYSSPEQQGQELLAETLSQDSALDGQLMPKAITCGTFHDLADFDAAKEPEIGWHPDFESLAKGASGSE